jgi:hypothetical protein
VDVFVVDAVVTQSQAATCHARYDELRLHGEALFRAEDGAFVEATLSGPVSFSYDVCNTSGRGRQLVRGSVTSGTAKLTVTRACFRTPLARP